MNNTITDVVRALELVDQRFYGLFDIAFSEDKLIENERIKKLERRFMIEFSRQYAKITEDNGNRYDRVEYDFEIPKKFMWYENPDLEIRNTWERLNKLADIDMIEYFTTYPDFIVHADQRNMNDQRLIIEAKVNHTTSKAEVFKDIFHTFIYANKYNFQNNVLLLINIDLTKWLQWLSDYRRKGFYLGNPNRYESIYFISRQSAKSPIVVETLATYLLNFYL
jgi:hypothetical protein